MGTAVTIGAEIERHRAEMNRLVADLKARILAGPDNPRRKLLAPRCGVVRFSDFAAHEFAVMKDGAKKMRPSNWSAEHHNFRTQYETVVKAIDGAYADRAVDVVVEAVETGVVRVRNGSESWTINLHPDVVSYLRNVLKL